MLAELRMVIISMITTKDTSIMTHFNIYIYIYIYIYIRLSLIFMALIALSAFHTAGLKKYDY